MSETMSPSFGLAASGLRAQAARMRIIAENVANAASTAQTPDADPYRRQIPVFQAELDRASGLEVVRMNDVAEDPSEFPTRYEPGHPAADARGYVKYPNVQTLIEMMDMRAAQRAYQANLNVIESARSMASGLIELMRR